MTPPDESLAADAARYWSRSSADDQIREYSHWRGEGRYGDDSKWSGIGEKHWGFFERLRDRAADAGPMLSMAEWGPGGGANAVRFSRSFTTFHGIDISATNLEECGRQLDAADYAGFHPILIDAAEPERVPGLIPAPIDFFLSTAVYQHFPAKDYGVRVTNVAAQILRPGGLALIQIRYDDGSERFAPKSADYDRNAITFTSYRLDEFDAILDAAGFDVIDVTLKAENCYAHFSLRRNARTPQIG